MVVELLETVIQHWDHHISVGVQTSNRLRELRKLRDKVQVQSDTSRMLCFTFIFIFLFYPLPRECLNTQYRHWNISVHVTRLRLILLPSSFHLAHLPVLVQPHSHGVCISIWVVNSPAPKHVVPLPFCATQSKWPLWSIANSSRELSTIWWKNQCF